MTKKELLDLEREKWGNEIPLLDYVYVIPTRRKHDSGYYCMEIIGTTQDGKYKKKLSTYSDVVDIGDYFQPSKNVSFDIPEYGVIRFFNTYGCKFKIIWWGVSSFRMVAVKKELEEQE